MRFFHFVQTVGSSGSFSTQSVIQVLLDESGNLAQQVDGIVESVDLEPQALDRLPCLVAFQEFVDVFLFLDHQASISLRVL